MARNYLGLDGPRPAPLSRALPRPWRRYSAAACRPRCQWRGGGEGGGAYRRCSGSSAAGLTEHTYTVIRGPGGEGAHQLRTPRTLPPGRRAREGRATGGLRVAGHAGVASELATGSDGACSQSQLAVALRAVAAHRGAGAPHPVCRLHAYDTGGSERAQERGLGVAGWTSSSLSQSRCAHAMSTCRARRVSPAAAPL